MRQKIVAGNWKMNTTLSEGIDLVNQIVAKIEKLDTLALYLYDKFTVILRFLITHVLGFIETVFNFLFGEATDNPPLIMQMPEEEKVASNPVFNVISTVIFIFLALVLLFIFVKIIISVIKSLSVSREIQTQTIEDEDMIEIKSNGISKKDMN